MIMRKKMITILLCISMMTSLLAGCGGTQKASDSEADKSVSEEEKASSSDEPDEEENSEPNDYGLTDTQQEKLVECVKDSVTGGYLEKYSIPAADFKLQPFDANDLNNYVLSEGEYIYTGADSYECADLWYVIDETVINSDVKNRMLTGMAAGDKETAKIILEKDGGIMMEDTLEAQSNKNIEMSGSGIVLKDTSSQNYDLKNAVYGGIAKFMNGLEEEERVDVLFHLYEIEYNSESVLVESMEREVHSVTMFDRVISENIQFE